MKIGAVVVLYNFNENHLKKIETYDKFVDEVVLVDNSDNREFYEKSKTQINKYTYINMNENVGIAKALNEGITYLYNKGYDWVLTMDQDSAFQNNIIKGYKDYILNNNTEKVAILSPNYLINRRRNHKYTERYEEIGLVMQSANLMNIKIFMANGMFEEKLFIDCVDYDYCQKALNNGYKIIRCNEAKLIHEPGVEKVKKILFYDYKYGWMNETRFYYQIRNLNYLYDKYHVLKFKIIKLYKILKVIFLFDNKKEYFKMLQKGNKDFKNNVYGKINKG